MIIPNAPVIPSVIRIENPIVSNLPTDFPFLWRPFFKSLIWSSAPVFIPSDGSEFREMRKTVEKCKLLLDELAEKIKS